MVYFDAKWPKNDIVNREIKIIIYFSIIDHQEKSLSMIESASEASKLSVANKCC